jgi:hypothetical protein
MTRWLEESVPTWHNYERGIIRLSCYRLPDRAPIRRPET